MMDSWSSAPDHPNLSWKTEGETLFCKYCWGAIETTWDDVEKIAKLNFYPRRDAIIDMFGKKRSNKRDAMTLFTRLLAEGKIKRPAPKMTMSCCFVGGEGI
jgi:hypothetical protein